MSPNQHKPVIIALVVCDNIYTEPSGKRALVGLFNNIYVKRCPATHYRMAVFVSVTDVEPGSEGKLDIVHAETYEPVVEAIGMFPNDIDRLKIVDMNFFLPPLVFPEVGSYYIRFFANSHILVQRPFEVISFQSLEGSPS